MNEIDKFTIVVDTREQDPWSFSPSKYCAGSITKQVKHGDYAILGHEDLLFLDRKASVPEIAQNIISKRFINLLEKSRNYPYKYIVCEFSVSQLLSYPYGSGLPKSVIKKIRLPASVLISKIIEIEREYGVKFVFCNSAYEASQYAFAIMKSIYKIECTNV